MVLIRILIVAAVSALANAALACGFHSYVPQPTLVDRLLASEHVVLARSDPENPFRFKGVEALQGELQFVDIPQLVDSVTRRRLAADPAATVLFARDGAYGPWQRLAYVDDAMSDVLNRIMARLQVWEFGDDADRATFFAALADHPDPPIRDMALRELDLVDYGILRKLDVQVDPGHLTARLNVLSEADLKPVRILLLGLLGAPDLGAMLRSGVARNAASANALLGAYATAAIELGGPEAAASLAETYLADATLPIASRESIAEALAIHAQVGDPATAAASRNAAILALRGDPALAPVVARQFGMRSDWSLGAPLMAALQSNALTSLADILLVNQYVALSNPDGALPAN